MLFSSTYCAAMTIVELKEKIKQDLCPSGNVTMRKIVKDTSKFNWKHPKETVLLFPALTAAELSKFPSPTLKNNMNAESIKYAQDSLRLIPPFVRKKNKFLDLYETAITTVKETGIP